MSFSSIDDLIKLDDIFWALENDKSGESARLDYFYSACKTISPYIEYITVENQCPHGGKIGMGNSKMHNFFKKYKTLRLHAILHDASGYMKREWNKGSGYVYVMQCPINNCFLGHVTGILFCFYIKFFQAAFFTSLRC